MNYLDLLSENMEQKYKSYRLVEGKPRWVIVDGYGKIINKEPNKEELRCTEEEKYIKKYGSRVNRRYSDTNTCSKIKEDGTICGNMLVLGGACQERDEKEKLTGRWICAKCYKKEYVDDRKYIADRRTGNQNSNSPNAKGDKAEKLTCLWQNVENLNVKNDNHRFPIDHSRHPILGVLQTKSKWYDPVNRWWAVKWKNEWNKEFDNLIFYCVSKDGKYIERIYIFPICIVVERTGVVIDKYIKYIPWYEQYRVKDENTLKHVNDLWGQIIDKGVSFH